MKSEFLVSIRLQYFPLLCNGVWPCGVDNTFECDSAFVMESDSTLPWSLLRSVIVAFTESVSMLHNDALSVNLQCHDLMTPLGVTLLYWGV
jgi:hypothetical protein